MIALSPPTRVCLALGLTLPLIAATAGMFTAPDPALLYQSWWPRLATALLAGGGLALAGAVMQQALRNPLATPTTLGVISGAQFALLVATVAFPGMLALGREWVALAGGGLAMGAVVLLAWRRRLAPVVVILAGLVINLYLGSLSIVMLLLHQEQLYGMLIWGAGSLAQSGWNGVDFLWPRLLVAAPLAAVLARPLDILSLGDAQARSLGLSLHQIRLAALAVAVFLAACVTSVVGVVGFVGLAAPAAVRLLGVRGFGAVAAWSVLLGALLLAVIDLLLQSLSASTPFIIPTGAMTAVLGGPLLLWLLLRLKLPERPPPPQSLPSPRARRAPPRWWPIIATLAVAVGIALVTGQTPDGWRLVDMAQASAMLEWRLPRTVAAGSAGAILALAGVILQRLTQNPLASPELLGVSGGAALGLIGSLFLLPGTTAPVLVTAGIVGALAGIAVVILLNRRYGFIPERVLLTGVAVTATVTGIQTVLLAGGDPRTQQAIAWMSGSTYYVDMPAAVTIAVTATFFLLVVPVFSRWLNLLPLGAATATALGVRVTGSRLVLLLLVAVLTACATLIVGPLSFVGLLAPHMARLMGFAGARAHLLGAACLGCLLMVAADWMGRHILYPQEIPAGLVASLLAGTYFVVGMRRL